MAGRMMATIHEALRVACADVGIVYRDVPVDGRFHETDVEGDRRGRGDGRIKLFPDGEGGIVCNWKGETRPFFADDGRKLSEAERRERDRQRAETIRKAEEEEAMRRAEAANKSAAIWKAATSASADHPYLSRKHVSSVATLREIDASAAAAILGYAPKSSGETLAGRVLVAPVKVGAKLSTCELIDEAGRKSAIYGGAKAGGYWAAQSLPEGDGDGLKLLIGEGVATVLSAKEASGHPSIAALSAGNLPAVAKAMREDYPAAALVILADLVKATGETDPHAIEAARSVGGLLAVPDFGADRPEGATDFNDLHQAQGLEAVKQAIARALSETDVTHVTDVQANNGAASSVTAEAAADVTDVTSEGEPAIPDESNRPCFNVFDDWQPLPDDTKLRPGVWFFGIRAGKKSDDAPTLTQQWICSPLHIEAVTFDGQDNNFGRLLRFKNTLGRWREWAMPMELLRGAGDDLRGELLAMGVLIDPHAKNLLAQYLQAITPKRRVHCALQVGWCGKSYVLPDTVIGPAASGVIFQSGERGHDEHTRGGTLAGWKSDIAARAVGNPLLTLALSASFTGPMLARCIGESGGIHFFGDSSTGKTTIIEAACATWGGENFRRSWRATANGMEGAAALFNDCLLTLDEISECDPKEVGLIVYALANGRGKQRASRTGNARSVTRWRCVVLSSGERTITTTMAEGGYRTKAGQSVRLLDIPVARRFGAFDDLHGLPSGAAFADAIRRAAVAHHGHAGRAFLEKLTRDGRDFCELLERFKALPEFSADGGEGQDKRTAGRFALLALAGEVTTDYGITGWPEGAAIEAAAEGFNAWRSTRGRGNNERRQILERVSGFIERHGDSRFSNANANASDDAMRINRAGWWHEESGGRVYLFNAEGLREALKGFDFRRALDTLQEAGALPKADASGERAKAQRIDGRLVRLYPIQADKLGGDHGA
jgi:putative DNA primase/helicase